MSEHPTSKELVALLRKWHALKGESCFREAADEIERLQEKVRQLEMPWAALAKQAGTDEGVDADVWITRLWKRTQDQQRELSRLKNAPALEPPDALRMMSRLFDALYELVELNYPVDDDHRKVLQDADDAFGREMGDLPEDPHEPACGPVRSQEVAAGDVTASSTQKTVDPVQARHTALQPSADRTNYFDFPADQKLRMREALDHWRRNGYDDEWLLLSMARAAQPSNAVYSAAQVVLDAYQSRFETGTGNYFGPIDDEIAALRSALTKLSNQGDQQ